MLISKFHTDNIKNVQYLNLTESNRTPNHWNEDTISHDTEW